MTPLLGIATYARDGVALFSLGVLTEIFADRSARGLPAFQVTICTDEPGLVRTDAGLSMTVQSGLDALAVADMVFSASGRRSRRAAFACSSGRRAGGS